MQWFFSLGSCLSLRLQVQPQPIREKDSILYVAWEVKLGANRVWGMFLPWYFLNILCHCVFREKGSTPWTTADTSPACQACKKSSSTNTWRPQGSCLQRGTSGRAEKRPIYPAVYYWTNFPHFSARHPPWLNNKALMCGAIQIFDILLLFSSSSYFSSLLFDPCRKYIYYLDFSIRWWLLMKAECFDLSF